MDDINYIIWYNITPASIRDVFACKTNLRPLLWRQSLNNLATQSNLVLCIIEIKKCLPGPYCWMASDRVIAYATNINKSSRSIIFNASHRNNNCSWQQRNLKFYFSSMNFYLNEIISVLFPPQHVTAHIICAIWYGL